jgi:TolB protein
MALITKLLAASLGLILITASGKHTAAQEVDLNPFDMDWSPTTEQIVFSDLENGIWIVNSVDGTLTDLTSQFESTDTRPQFSPDGNYIAFISDRSGTTDLWVMESDGENPLNLSESITELEGQAYAWHPSQNSILFTSTPDPESDIKTNTLWIIDLSNFVLTKVLAESNTAYDLPSWSADGEKIAFMFATHGSDELQTAVYNLTTQELQVFGPYYFPAWSPTDNQLIMLEFCAETQSGFNLLLYDLTAAIRLTDNDNQCSAGTGIPQWSQDGKFLLYQSLQESINGSFAFAIMEVETSQVNPLTDIPADVMSVAWSPNGSYIAYVGITGREISIFLLDLNTSEISTLVN